MNVAYDIDETLLDLRGNPIQIVLKELIKDFYNGNKIYLITARPNIPPSIEFTKMQLRNAGINKYIDIENNVFYTTAGSKVPMLRDLNIQRFYDDYCINIVDICNNIRKLHPNFKLYQILYCGKKGYSIMDTYNKPVCFNCPEFNY